MSRRVRVTVVAAVAALLLGPGAPARPAAAVPFDELDPVPDTPAPTSLALPVATTAANTFSLHSDPGSSYTIYLDFVGFTLSGTLWNTVSNILTPSVTVPSWDPDGDGSAFAADELSRVQEIWRRVAADFAPFDVDVTTENPGSAALIRSGSTDHQYGVRALFLGTDSASRSVYSHVCNSACGGISFQPSFGATDLTPALVFTGSLGPNDPKYIADAASHELGHTLGLSHDGLYPNGSSSHQEYYAGRNGWGPLMGDPYGMPLSQWSDGGYANASNTEDDVSIIRSTVGVRPDESGASPSGAVPLGTGDGFITSRSDADTYALGQCSGDVQVSAAPTAVGTDLDLDLQLLDAAGNVLARSNPPMSASSYASATGLGASISTTLAPGAYYVRVAGAGAPSDNPYDDYGSLGEYQVSGSGGCAPTVASGTPGAPGSVTATPSTSAAAITVRWKAPADAATAGLTGYRVSLGGSTVDVGPGTLAHTFTGLSLDTDYVATVAALNGAGAGVPAGAAAHTSAVIGRAPGRVGSLAAHWHRSGRYLRVTWQRPAYTGGTPILRYRIVLDGHRLGSVAASRTAVTVRNVRRGRHVVVVRAINAVGISPVVRRVVRIPRHR